MDNTTDANEKLQKKPAMVWSQDMDKTMLQEMAAEGVLHHKLKSRSRGMSWQRVADKVNALPVFDVNVKSIRDRFKLLAKKHKAKMGKEERSTGGGDVEQSEVEILLEDLIEIEDDTNQRAEEDHRAKKMNEDEDRAKALEMRKRAMESMGETRERLGQTSGEEKKRRTAKKSMEFLEKAIEKKQQMEEEKKKAREEERHEHDAFLRQLEATIQQQAAQHTRTEQHLLQNLTMQQQQQQQQMHQFAAMQNSMMALMEQQRQQSEMIMELIKKQPNQ